jgi:phosphotransferase system IIA component
MVKTKTYNVLLDTKESISNPAFHVNTNDLKTVKLTILINQDKEPLDLTGATVRLAVKKPDRKTVLQDCTIVDPLTGSCEIILSTQAYAVEGSYAAEVMVYFEADTVAVTSSFNYTAKKGILNDDTIESTNEWQSITQAIADTEAVLAESMNLTDHTITYSYYTDGNIQTVTEKDSANNVVQTVTYTYNASGDVSTSVTVKNGKTFTTNYNYDANGNIQSTSNVIS